MQKDEIPGWDEIRGKAPTGGAVLSEDRLRILRPAWEANYRSLRRMDELSLGEIEPATLFVWEGEQP